MKVRYLAVSAIVATSIFGNALACGDSLYRAGKGLSYRTYSAPLPANLLVFGTNDEARALAQELAKSGHDVHFVDSADALAGQLGKGQYDIVIAPYSERQAVEATTAAASFLPVALNSDEEKLAKQSYGRVMVSDKHEIKHYLKAIHRALKESA